MRRVERHSPPSLQSVWLPVERDNVIIIIIVRHEERLITDRGGGGKRGGLRA